MLQTNHILVHTEINLGKIGKLLRHHSKIKFQHKLLKTPPGPFTGLAKRKDLIGLVIRGNITNKKTSTLKDIMCVIARLCNTWITIISH